MFSARSRALLRSALAVSKSTRNSDGNIIVAGFATASVSTNYYEALGISKNSTQTDIKAAYYKLSMQFHPDKNQGCTMSATKFREITQAYEVLGNYRLRRLYDKGAIHATAEQVADVNQEPDDPQTKFYKSRFTKSKVVDAHGRTPIYNFDEWSRAHYGDSFQKRKDAKEKFERKRTQYEQHILAEQNQIVFFGVLFSGIGMYVLFQMVSNHDEPKRNERKEAVESSEKT